MTSDPLPHDIVEAAVEVTSKLSPGVLLRNLQELFAEHPALAAVGPLAPAASLVQTFRVAAEEMDVDPSALFEQLLDLSNRFINVQPRKE